MKNICLYGFSGEIITPNDPNYEEARQEWNRSVQKFPLAIAFCENIEDVSSAIHWARSEKVPIRIRSGGHNYEGYSVGDKVLVIDISPMNNIEIFEEEKRVKIQGGVTNSQFYNTVSKKNYPLPGGTCPSVGVSGYCLGRGWGLSARHLGLGCDSLVELEMVNFEGEIIVANELENSDLFWACRGAGGGNFGVIVSLTFELPSKVDKVTTIELCWPKATSKTQMAFLETWQKWIVQVDGRINMNGGIYNTKADGTYAYLRGICFGTPEETKKIIDPFRKITDVEETYEYLTFLEAFNKFTSGYPPFEKFKSTGRFVGRIFEDFELKRLMDIVSRQRPEGSILTSIGVYGLGGKVKDIGKHETAYYYRNSNYILSLQSVWEDNKFKPQNVDWVEENFEYIYKITKGSYVNFPYCELVNYEEQYYGTNAAILKCIKRKYDPLNVFNFPQSIRLS